MDDQTPSSGANYQQQDQEIPPDLFAARISGDPETLAKLIQQFELDVGCRGTELEVNPDGTRTVLIYASEDRIRELQAAGYKVERGENVSELGRQRQKEIGKGDRFEGGRIAPRGLGGKPGRDRKGGTAS